MKKSPNSVHRTVTSLLKAGLITQPPVWLSAVQRHPPPPLPVRVLSQTLAFPAPNRSIGNSNKRKHLRFKYPRPQEIVYPEDILRKRFYADHPWEAYRPYKLFETDQNPWTKQRWAEGLKMAEQHPAEITGEEYLVSSNF